MNYYIIVCNPYDLVEILKLLQREIEQSNEQRARELEEIKHQIYRAIGKAEEV